MAEKVKKTTNEVITSVIIVSFNTRELLIEAIKSVIRNDNRVEIIVVDNGSIDGSAELISKLYPDIMIIKNQINEKFAKPNNDAVKLAKGKYIFLLNSDAQLLNGSLDILVDFMEENPEVGICGPQLRYPDGKIQRSCRGKMTLWTHICDMLFLDYLFPNSRIFASSEMYYFDHKTELEVDHLMAAAILIRRDVIDKVGLFDEKLTLYFNDMDFSIRVKKYGWKIVFNPSASAIHYNRYTTKKINIEMGLVQEMFDNLFYFYQKNYGKVALLIVKFFTVIGYFVRTLLWSSLNMIRKNSYSNYMLKFSIKALSIALRTWKFY